MREASESSSSKHGDHMGSKAGEGEGGMGPKAGEGEGGMGPKAGEGEGGMGPKVAWLRRDLYRERSEGGELLTSHRESLSLPTSYFLPPTSYLLLPTSHFLLPTSEPLTESAAKAESFFAGAFTSGTAREGAACERSDGGLCRCIPSAST